MSHFQPETQGLMFLSTNINCPQDWPKGCACFGPGKVRGEFLRSELLAEAHDPCPSSSIWATCERSQVSVRWGCPAGEGSQHL